MNWNSIVIIICILLLAFSLYKEVRRENKARLIWRVVASIIAVAMLVLIALPLTYSTGKIINDDNGAVLITPGFNKDSLALYPKNKFFTFDPSIQKEYPKTVLTGASALAADSPAVSSLHVMGYGLDESELAQLSNTKIDFHPTPAPSGISAIGWNSHLKTGEQFHVQGSFKNTSAKPVKLVLKGLSAALDSAIIAPKTTIDFDLTTKPKHAGRATFSIEALSAKDTLEKELLPVEISAIKPLSVLVLAASPDFENKFLKSWLSQNGYAVATRAAISKAKYSEEFVNLQKLSLDHLNASILQKFDVVIGDLSVLKSLSPAENDALRQEVTQKGLGVIIREDSSGKAASWLQASFPVERSSVKTQTPVSLLIRGNKEKTAKLNIDPTYIANQDVTQPLVTDEQGHVIASSTQSGAGKLLFTTLSTSYNWMLGGDQNDYTAYWSLMIDQSARKTPVKELWSVSTPLPTEKEPVSLKLESSAMPASVQINATSVAPAQNPFIAFESTNTYWPSGSGWQQVKQGGGNTSWWYAWPKTSWPNIRAMKRLTDTRLYVQQHVSAESVTKQIQQKQELPVPKIYFYILFLVACSYLWAEGKFSI